MVKASFELAVASHPREGFVGWWSLLQILANEPGAMELRSCRRLELHRICQVNDQLGDDMLLYRIDNDKTLEWLTQASGPAVGEGLPPPPSLAPCADAETPSHPSCRLRRRSAGRRPSWASWRRRGRGRARARRSRRASRLHQRRPPPGPPPVLPLCLMAPRPRRRQCCLVRHCC
jgi:hypothetical protein